MRILPFQALLLPLLAAPAFASDVYQEAKLEPPDLDTAEWAGKDVAIDGDWAALAVPRDMIDGRRYGAVQVWHFDGSSWTHVQKIRPTFLEEYDAFGTSVAIQGDLMAIGAVGDDDLLPEAGAVYLYEWSGSTWQPTQTLYPSDPVFSDYFGSEIEIDGDRMAIGARFWGPSGGLVGAAYVFVNQGGTWVQEDKVTASDGATWDSFGAALDLSGDRLVVGALTHDGLAQEGGAAYVYGRSGSDWTELQKLLPFDGGIGDRFGYRVAIWEDRIAIGSPQDDTLVGTGGSVYCYVEGPGGYTLEQKVYANVPAGGSEFGRGVDLHGDLLVVGASEISSNDATMYIFRHDGSTWVQSQEIVPDNVFATGKFAEDVETDGARILAGAFEDYVDIYGQEGSGFVYVVPPALTAYCTAKTSSGGCVPSIGWSGEPTASGSAPFTITATQVPNREFGMFFFSTGGRAALPFQGGTLCVDSPVLRTFVQSSGGSPFPVSDCSGAFTIDFAAEIAARPALGAGTWVNGQFWFRDPGDMTGPGLSNAIEFVILP